MANVAFSSRYRAQWFYSHTFQTICNPTEHKQEKFNNLMVCDILHWSCNPDHYYRVHLLPCMLTSNWVSSTYFGLSGVSLEAAELRVNDREGVLTTQSSGSCPVLIICEVCEGCEGCVWKCEGCEGVCEGCVWGVRGVRVWHVWNVWRCVGVPL